MNAPTFDAYPSVCPLCQHSSLIKPHKLFSGLVVCEHCQERLVVSRNGHFVRDPFRLRQAKLERSLRRESHPFYRILRDLNLTRSPVWLVVLISLLLLGMGTIFADRLSLAAPNNGSTESVETP